MKYLLSIIILSITFASYYAIGDTVTYSHQNNHLIYAMEIIHMNNFNYLILMVKFQSLAYLHPGDQQTAPLV